jgi:ubiquinone/menaquinone biosynthesis C-methylase UbiE
MPVPRSWLGEIQDKSILCLASGGGQQAPILAAAGAKVTSFDLSDNQLARDRLVAEREGLEIILEQGNMADLSRFSDASFDLIFNPLSNPYLPNLYDVWGECHRVLKAGGRLLAGSMNPLYYLFEENDGEGDEGLTVIHKLPFVEYDTLSKSEKEDAIKRKMLLTWSHSLEDIIGGQIKVGFRLVDLFECRRQDARAPNINTFTPTYIATQSIKEDPWTAA